MTENGERGRGPRLVVGERVTLVRFTRDDLALVRRWLDDPELRVQIGATGPMDESQALEWYRGVESDPSRMWYTVRRNDDDAAVGEAGLLRIFPEWRTTDMSVIIGEREERGKGYGTDAGRLLLDLAFNYLGLHRVAVGVVGFHDAALRFWEALGFVREGVQRDGYLVDGRYHDFVMMSILEQEWRRAGHPSSS